VPPWCKKRRRPTPDRPLTRCGSFRRRTASICSKNISLEDFPIWAQRVLRIQFSNREFVAWNAFAFALICLGALLVSRHARFRFIEIAMAIAVLGNVAAHVIGSLVTWTYSPGLITGVFAWIPLASVRLQIAFRASSHRGRVAGTCIGVFVTVVILASELWTRTDQRPRDQRRDPGVQQTPL
jgi:multisubunit Na+/H+ antiporter MnhF subunit